jgi:hypothetical protein
MNLLLGNTKLSLDPLNSKQDLMSSKQDQYQVKFSLLGLTFHKLEKEYQNTKTKSSF